METKNLSLHHIIRAPQSIEGHAPALLMFHGYGSNENDLFSFAQALPEDLFIISARAPHPISYGGYAWYDLIFEPDGTKTQNIDQAIGITNGILSFIDQCCKAYTLDPSRISLMGFSQGAILGYASALIQPQKVKNLIALSGYIDERLLSQTIAQNDFSSLNIYCSHGVEDSVIPIARAREAKNILSKLGVSYVFNEFNAGHGVVAENFYSFRDWFLKNY